MNKKILVGVTSAIMILVMAGCGQKAVPQVSPVTTQATQSSSSPASLTITTQQAQTQQTEQSLTTFGDVKYHKPVALNLNDYVSAENQKAIVNLFNYKPEDSTQVIVTNDSTGERDWKAIVADNPAWDVGDIISGKYQGQKLVEIIANCDGPCTKRSTIRAVLDPVKKQLSYLKNASTFSYDDSTDIDPIKKLHG